MHTDREGLHRTIKADIANSTNVSPAYTGNNKHYHINQSRAISSYHNYHYHHHHDNIIISATKYEFVYFQINPSILIMRHLQKIMSHLRLLLCYKIGSMWILKPCASSCGQGR